MVRLAAIAGGGLLAAACAPRRGLPPLWERESELPGNLAEDRAVFGLVSRTTGEDGARLSAIRPLLAEVDDGKGSVKSHFVPPFVSHSQNERGEKTMVVPLFYDEVFGSEEDEEAGRADEDTFLFPILAWGSEPREGSYFAAFPLYGTLKSKILAERLEFVAFPAYVHTRSGDWESTHLLWPLIAWGESGKRSHFRVMPFWSQSDSPSRSSRTLLWPIGHWGTQRRGERTFDSWFVFPLLGHRTSRDGASSEWTVLFPFFEFAHDDKTGDDHLAAPWPFYRRAVRPGRSESAWYWPFHGWFESHTERSAWYAWPIVWHSDEVRGSYVFRHRYVVPFWMRRSTTPVGGVTAQEGRDEELRSWPFFSWRRRPDSHESMRIPEIVPVFGWEPGETLYADLVAILRWSADDEGREAWDGPLGIVRFRRDASGSKTLTLLWWIDIPLGGGR